jgi:glucokinase
MGGTKILASALNSTDGIMASLKKPTKSNSKNKEYAASLASIVKDLIKENNFDKDKVKAVCIGIPGSLNPYTGVVGLAPNLGIKNYNLKEKLQEKINYPVLIENDVNLGGLGIKNFGVGKEAINMLAVFIGTGIGGALFFDKKIYRGSSFAAGEIGHMIVQKNGPLCGCGKRGCFEAVASRTAIAKKIEASMKKNKKSILNKLVKPGDKIKSKALAAAVKKEDPVVIKHISEECETIGTVLASIANLLNLDMIVLGGGLIEALDNFMMPHIKSAFKDHVLKTSAKGLKIVSSKLGDNAAIYGGIALAEEFLGIKV